jgi:hypothetical protein
MPTLRWVDDLRFQIACMLAVVCGLTAVRPAAAQIPFVELNALSPSAAQVGSSFELRVTANHMEELARLDFSNPLVSAEQRMEKPRLLSEWSEPTGVFQVSVDAKALPGIAEVRAVGRFGVSNPRTLLITQQSILPATSDHSDPALAIELPAGKIIIGACPPQKRNYYRRTLAAGDVLRVAAYTQQLDSRATPTIVLYGPDRQELARSRGMGPWPAEIEQQVDESGDYLLAVHDFLFLGGQEYAYALEANVRSPSDQPRPLELDQLLRPSLDDSPEASEGLSLVRIFADGHDRLTAASESTTELTVPFLVQGDFADDSAQTIDFQGQAGQQLWIEVDSAALDQITDPRVVVYKVNAPASADGPAQMVQLAENDDGPSLGDAAMRLRQPDPRFSWTVPEDGVYRIALSDFEGGDRPPGSTGYRLTVREQQPGFKLLTYPPFPTNNAGTSRAYGANLLRGGTEAIRVLAIRDEGFSGAIEVSADDLPAGVTAQPVVISAAANENTLTLVSSEDAPAWCGPISIVGHSQQEPQQVYPARTATVVWPASPTHNAIVSRQTKQLFLGVNSQDTAPLLVQLGDGQVLEVKQGEKLSIPIKVTRRAGGDAACVLRPQNLPAKVTLGELTIPADKSEAVAALTVAGDAPLGESTFWMQNETKIKWRENPQRLEREQAYLAKLNEALAQADAATDKSPIEAAIKTATERVEELKKQTAEKQLTVWLPTTTQRIRVVAK